MDLIDRQAAIDYLVDNMTWYDEDGCESDEGAKRHIIEELMNGVPSAQPEIIMCKDCIKRDICRTTNIWAVPPGDDWYCGDAERRTDDLQ